VVVWAAFDVYFLLYFSMIIMDISAYKYTRI